MLRACCQGLNPRCSPSKTLPDSCLNPGAGACGGGPWEAERDGEGRGKLKLLLLLPSKQMQMSLCRLQSLQTLTWRLIELRLLPTPPGVCTAGRRSLGRCHRLQQSTAQHSMT